MTRKWNIVNNEINAKYDIENEIIYNTEVLKSSLCNYNNAYILARGNVTIARNNAALVSFKNWSLFNECITKIVGAIIDDT